MEEMAAQAESHAVKILRQLGLTEYYPSKISLQDVMTVGRICSEHENDLSNVAWLILQKLIMLDYNGRDSYLSTATSKDQGNVASDEGDGFTIDSILSGDDSNETEDMEELNPLDVLITIYSCCDLLLKQTLAQKMFLCRLAVPFICPQLKSDCLTYSLWALRSIIVEWKNKDSIMCETSVVNQKMKIVSFIRLGKPSCSKSILLNNVLSDEAQNTFWNRECPLGHTEACFSDGLVEATWYLPAGKPTDKFQEAAMFLNLRGDACKHVKQMQILSEISNVIVCCIETEDLQSTDIRDTMKKIHGSSSKVVLFLTMQQPNQTSLKRQLGDYVSDIDKRKMANTMQILGFQKGRVKTLDDTKKELCQAINRSCQDQKSICIEDASGVATKVGINIDEHDEFCQDGKDRAQNVISCIEGKPIHVCKEEMLPAQGSHWHKWSELQKEKQKVGAKEIEISLMHDVAAIEEDMIRLRKEQFQECNNLSELMTSFQRNLLETIDSPVAILYMQWLKIYLDELSQEKLPGIQKDYWSKQAEIQAVKKDTKSDIDKTTELKMKLKLSEQQLAGSSLGVEHLLRELGQMYEAVIESGSELQKETGNNIRVLPEIAAKLLLKGMPIEVMDGDAGNVPLTWFQAVMSNLITQVGNKKLFVISVLGIQSSGKSTMLNTMFGLQFPVSAGRCTRGVFMQLIQVDKKMDTLPYDYVLVVDTEGLRAPELAELNCSHDNQLATFVIGLGDVTIMNIKGENMAEISDLLQITVHAFLRMKLVNQRFQLHRTCLFIHQNVSATNAKDKTSYGCQKRKENLDRMTESASCSENIADIKSFDQVIRFDAEENVFHIPDLWYGYPPMARTSFGYTEAVQEVKQCLLYDLIQEEQSLLRFSDLKLRIQDLWKGILSDDFVFSFRNSLAAKAYKDLENIYLESTWTIEKDITDWLTETAAGQLGCCLNCEELDQCLEQLESDLTKKVEGLSIKAQSHMEKFFDNHESKDILSQWRTEKLAHLNNDIKSILIKYKEKLCQAKRSIQSDLFLTEKQQKWKRDIMERSKALADEMKEAEADQERLLRNFNEFWSKCQDELGTDSENKSDQITAQVEELLLKHFTSQHTVVKEELKKHPLSETLINPRLEGSLTVIDICESHFTTCLSNTQRIRSIFTNQQQTYRDLAVEAVNTILKDVGSYLHGLKKLETPFHESYAKSVIMHVVSSVKEHNSQAEMHGFTLLTNLEVKVAVHACRYAINDFWEMQKQYEENKLDACRNTAWNLFKSTVNQSSVEVITADLLIGHLEELVQQRVKSKMTGELVNYTVKHFGYQKYNLLLNILEDLAFKDSFENYISFISDAKDFSHQWITSFIEKEFFSIEDAQYANYAEVHIQRLAASMEQAIQATTEHVLTQKHASMRMWIVKFGIRLNKLPIRETDLEHVIVQNVCDFKNLERLLIERLKELEKRVLQMFANETSESIKWEGKTPYSEIMEKLWGCEEQCPFCFEPCQKAVRDHVSQNDSHHCIQHRVQGVRGIKWANTNHPEYGKLVLETCNSNVMSKDANFKCSSCRFQCRNSGNCSDTKFKPSVHLYRDYKTYLPDWDIAPVCDLDSSKYWMWFMATYENELADYHEAKKPNIPKTWRAITKEQAVKSLRRYVV